MRLPPAGRDWRKVHEHVWVYRRNGLDGEVAAEAAMERVRIVGSPDVFDAFIGALFGSSAFSEAVARKRRFWCCATRVREVVLEAVDRIGSLCSLCDRFAVMMGDADCEGPDVPHSPGSVHFDAIYFSRLLDEVRLMELRIFSASGAIVRNLGTERETGGGL